MYPLSGADLRQDSGILRLPYNDAIHAESSYKRTIPAWLDLAQEAGWQSERVWTGEQTLSSIHLLASEV